MMGASTKIDLTPFCASGPSRYDLETPYTIEGESHATDGRVLLRVAAHGEPDDPARKFPLESVRQILDEQQWEGGFALFPQTFEVAAKAHWRACRVCDGEGCDISTKDCDVCPHCTDGEVPSAIYLIDGFGFDAYYIDHMKALPHVQYKVVPPLGVWKQGLLLVRFDGGTGVLMPIAVDR